MAEVLGSATSMEPNRKRCESRSYLKCIPESKGTCNSRNVFYVCLCVDMYCRSAVITSLEINIRS